MSLNPQFTYKKFLKSALKSLLKLQSKEKSDKYKDLILLVSKRYNKIKGRSKKRSLNLSSHVPLYKPTINEARDTLDPNRKSVSDLVGKDLIIKEKLRKPKGSSRNVIKKDFRKVKLKGWKLLYIRLKKSLRKSKGWVREWEESSHGNPRYLRNWHKRLKSQEASLSQKISEKGIAEFFKKEKNSFNPHFLRRKFYSNLEDPISLGYHEKCFNTGGLRNLRADRTEVYWLKKILKALKGKESLPVQESKKKVGFSKKTKTLKGREIFEYLRGFSRIGSQTKRKGNVKNYRKLKRIRKAKAFLRKGIPKKNIGIIHINAGLKNTIISLTDLKGDVKAWSSNGSVGFIRKKKKSPYASFVSGQAMGEKAKYLGYRGVIINLKGAGRGRHNSCRGLAKSGLKVLRIKDRIRLPHNGCRVRKKRRI